MLKPSPLSNPWFYFFPFLVANTLLSYFSLSAPAALWVGFFGLALPLGLALTRKAPGTSRSAASHSTEIFSSVPLWVWFGILPLVLGSRLFQLTTLSSWPHFDEGTCGYYALALSQKWSWRLFYAGSQAPPLFIWGLSALFKAGGTSLVTLWLFPALISLLAVPASYLAVRPFFSKSASFLCAILTAFSFWPLFLGRICLMTDLILLNEFFALAVLGWFLRSSTALRSRNGAALLGALTGLGFYIHIPWVGVAVLISAVFFISVRSNPSRPPHLSGIFTGSLGIVVLPLLWGALQQGYGEYFRYLWVFNGGSSLREKLHVALYYPQVLFWGIDPKCYTFQPAWGGFLNPILDSLFFLGVVEVFKNIRRPLEGSLAAAFFLFLLPGLLTREIEPLRVLPLLPVLIIITVIGLVRLTAFPGFSRPALLSLILLVPSAGLDAYHLWGPYHRVWDDPQNWLGYQKSINRYRAYEILEKKAKMEGPGLIFTDFVPGLCDQTLTVADNAFNAAQNPKCPLDDAKWAALLVNIHFQPFLAERFGPGRTYWLSKDLSEPTGGWMLWVVPVNDSNRKVFLHWREASDSLQPFIDHDLSYVRGTPYGDLLPLLDRAYVHFRGDPFLESCFWEKRADTLVKAGRIGDEETLDSFRNAIHRGYPAAHLFHKLGTLWLIRQNPTEARKAFEQALKAPLNFTNAASFLPRP